MLFLIFLLWLIFNGKVTLEICIFGVFITAGIYFFMHYLLGYSVKNDAAIFKKTGLFLEYVAVLLVEIIKANFTVTKIVFNKDIPLEQTLVYFNSDLKEDFTKALLADAITLTPGTITVSLDGNTYLVHCLSKEMLDGIENGKIANILRKMEA